MKPREKLQRHGPESLSIEELLSLIIGSGSERNSYSKISKKITQILKEYSIENLLLLLEKLKQIQGVGISRSSAIVAGFELGRRFYDPSLNQKTRITTSADAVRLFNDISSYRKEILKCAFVNARFELIKVEVVSMGSLDQVGIHPRVIISRALELNAYGLIISHNHPSGDTSPSSADLSATKQLREACDLMEVKLIDHIIVSISGWKSII